MPSLKLKDNSNRPKIAVRDILLTYEQTDQQLAKKSFAIRIIT